MAISPSCPTLLDMERIVIQELERTLRITRAGMITYSDAGLVEMGKLVESAALAIALETYSRDPKALRPLQPVLA